MGVYERDDSPFFWMLLEGHGRKKESTGIRRDATSAKIRKLNREAAEAVYHARMVQLARAKVGLPIDTGMTFHPWADWYDAHHIAKHASPDRERDILAHLRAHFGALVLSDIKPARWTEYVTARLAAGVSINTIGRELAVMKALLNAAVGEHLEVNPLVHVVRKTTKLPPKRTLTKADEDRLVKELHDDEMRDLYLVGVGTLLRQMNLITLRRREYHGGRLTIQTKTGPHAIDLSGPTTLQRRVTAILKRRMPATHDGYFFPKWHARFVRPLAPSDRRSKRVRTDDRRAAGNKLFTQAFRRACTRADIPWGLKNHGVVWHTATRASGATRLIREHGIDVRTVQLLGHWASLDQMAEYLGLDLAPATSRQGGIRRARRA